MNCESRFLASKKMVKEYTTTISQQFVSCQSMWIEFVIICEIITDIYTLDLVYTAKKAILHGIHLALDYLLLRMFFFYLGNVKLTQTPIHQRTT